MGLETVEIILDVERHFGVSLPDGMVADCVTVADLQALVVAHLALKGRSRSADLEAEVLREIVRISANVTGNDPSTIRPDSRWIGDVCLYG